MALDKLAKPIYGRNLLADLDSRYFEDCVVLCAYEAWDLVRDRFPTPPREMSAPRSMEQHILEKQIEAMPKAQVVFGIGGGSACDAAKMYAFKTGATLILMPSILSVDAAFTLAVGVRVDNRVRYVGEARAEKLLIDFDLLEAAPKSLNRAGVGDIISIFTALPDWKLAHEETGERYDAEIAAQSAAMLQRLFDAADDIYACNEAGLRVLAELYAEEVELCERFGNSRPEEGSEHYFAYCLESITKRPYIHGELISMAVILTGIYQGENVVDMIQAISAFGVEFRPEKIGITDEQIVQTLLKLPDYLAEEKQLLYGVYHHSPPSEDDARLLLKHFRRIIR